jgi:tetratricopeptide (TPR) repeat protein
MRLAILLVSMCGILDAQTEVPAAPVPQAAVPVVALDIAPLAAPDLDTPYASPRDAARHRLQATLAELRANRNLKAAMQGFAEALLIDRTYSLAAFNLGVVATIAEKWQDALGAFEEAARLDPNGLGKPALPQIERLRMIVALEATADGKRRRQYDEALYPLLARLPKLQPAEATEALAEVGRIDPKRWEAPALLAALSGNGRGYDVAAKFLEIAVAGAGDPAIKARLEKALHAAERELRYDAARISAEAAADRGEFEKAGDLYEAAWTTMPARAGNGMEAASAWLLHDDTAHAATLLIRLRESGNDEFAAPATAMLKELEPIEPGAKATASGAGQFFHDPGSPQPVHIADLIPPVNAQSMEILVRPIPRLMPDPEPFVLLAALSANAADAAQTAPIPVLPATRVPGEHPWRELSELRILINAGDPANRPVQTADLSAGGKTRRLLHVTSIPAGARVFAGDSSESICQTPCDVETAALGSHAFRFTLPGYEEVTKNVRITAPSAELGVILQAIRGSVIVETSAPATLKVNGTTIANPAPVELSLAPGLYGISADFGATARERVLMVKPGARLRLTLQP